jgi:CDP-diacylglycerol--glycerol-3-phosphate 3-phosphatidyltransferase
MISAGDETQVRPPKASNWNIANALTLLRIALVPVFAWFLLYDDGQQTTYRLLAAAIFVVATATDRLDGEIARSRGEVTDFGKVSDPIADKALMGMALIGLSILDLLPWWVTVVVLVRELGVTALRFVVIRHGVISASRGGKLKTALQAVAILLYILPLSSFWHVLAVVIMTLAVIVTMVTGIDYLLKAHTLRTTSPRAQLKRERRAAAALEGTAGAAGTGPDTTRSDAAQPDAAQPDAAQPDAAGSDAAKPDAAGSDAAKPDEGNQHGASPGAAARDQSSSGERSGRGSGPGV